MIVYGVHAVAFGHVGPTELVSAHLVAAEDLARRRSIQVHGEVYVTTRPLEASGPWQVVQVWKDGEQAPPDVARRAVSAVTWRAGGPPGAPRPPSVLDPPNGVC